VGSGSLALVETVEQVGIDPDSVEPLWVQLTDVIRDAIESGELHGRIPSAVQLGRMYGVSRDTALHALGQLQDEGLVVSRRGHGSFTV
jgi:GntR family transcriptional regulator